MNLLSNIESYFQSKPDNKQSSSSPTNNIPNVSTSNHNNNMDKTNMNNASKKRFLRKGCGTVNQRNKYEMERQKQAERKRQRQLGIIQSKPKTQKIILMEQWREKIKQKDKMLRKKKEQIAAIQAAQNVEENMMNININNDKQNKNKINQQNFIRPTKSFEANINSSLTSKKSVTNLNAMKLLKQKQKRAKIQRANTAPPTQINIDADFNTEQKTPSDELESASKFEEMQFEDAVLIKQHSDDHNNNNNEIEEKSSHQEVDNQDVGIWTMPKLPKKIMVKPSKGYNFARHSVNDRNKTAHFPSYSHHHHTSLYGGKRGKVNKMKHNGLQDNNNGNIPNANKNKYYSESKNLFHKQATINSMSKRDRLAAKYLDRKANEPQINAEKQYLLKTQELQQMISKYEEKCHDADMMKNSSLEAFRKYQSLINEKVGSLDQRQKDFEKYKKKQERMLMQKTAELDKRSRALLNIPDRKQRTQIEELKKEINDLKLEFQTKEKRFKSKVERLKKQNKKINQEKIELQNELKKIQKQQLENHQNQNIIRNHNHCSNTMPIVMSSGNKKPLTPNTMMMKQKKKKYSISKINVNTNRPKSQQSMRKPTVSYMATTPNATTMVNRSTNNLYEAYQNQQHQYMNNVQVISPFNNDQRYHNYMNNMNEAEYDSSSSESSSSSDESTKNGEDEEHKNNAVLVTNRNTQNLNRNNIKQLQSKQVQKQEDLVVEDSENEVVINHLPPVPDEFDPDKMSEEQYHCESVTNRDSPIERMQHPDGKIEQVYGDGSKLILFTNGTEKYIFSNLSGKYKQIYVKFPNGDIKKILEDGSEVYFYSKNNIIHATKIDGIELFYFSGQHEVHFPDETKHILFADGTKKYIYPNGDEQCVFPNKQ